MFFEILRFELRQQLKAPLFWIVALAFGAIAFAIASTDAVMLGGASGNVLRNAPLVTVRLLSVLTVLSVFLVTIFVAAAATRDFDQRTADMIFATPITRAAYLGGRFAAGYAASLAIMLTCVIGLALGSLMPWIDATRMGPFHWYGYAWAFGVMVLPDLLFMSALLYLLATATRSLLATYIGVIAYFVLQGVAGYVGRNINSHFLAAMLDPFGGRTLAIVTRYWTADQSNQLLPALDGVLLFNRLLWLGVSALLLLAAFALFRPDREGLRLPRRHKRAEPPLLRPQAGLTKLTLPSVSLHADARARWVQWRAQFVLDTMSILRGAAVPILLVLALVTMFVALVSSGQIYGTPLWPVTHIVLTTINGSFGLPLFIILIFYAGELVWR
ncbi:MAG: hypothetical protein ABI389_00830, partial [Rhodanobacter sp.]